MSTQDYQQIRLQLDNGSGQESPGFRALMQTLPLVWRSFETHYLQRRRLTVEEIYDSKYKLRNRRVSGGTQ